MNTVNAVCEWLADHEFVGWAIIIGTVACAVWAAGRILATRIPEKTFGD